MTDDTKQDGAPEGQSASKAMLDCVLPGSRILVWDATLFVDDEKTPDCWRLAKVVSRYGYRSRMFGDYPDCVDVLFDHRPKCESRGHFTDGVRAI
jgi:hypothetical protein